MNTGKQKCDCMQCAINKTIEQYMADHPDYSSGDVLDDLSLLVGVMLGRAHKHVKRSTMHMLVERSMRHINIAVSTVTNGVVQLVNLGEGHTAPEGRVH